MIDNRPPMDATGGAGSDSHVVTPPRGVVRPLSLRVHHVWYEHYPNLSLMIFRKDILRDGGLHQKDIGLTVDMLVDTV